MPLYLVRGSGMEGLQLLGRGKERRLPLSRSQSNQICGESYAVARICHPSAKRQPRVADCTGLGATQR
jgi:hypothetical protein